MGSKAGRSHVVRFYGMQNLLVPQGRIDLICSSPGLLICYSGVVLSSGQSAAGA
jgi:hypothetical protein